MKRICGSELIYLERFIINVRICVVAVTICVVADTYFINSCLQMFVTLIVFSGRDERRSMQPDPHLFA